MQDTHRIGTKRWDGVRISIGCTALIGNKEIEVDSQISSTDMPHITGTSTEYENDLEFGSPPQTQATRSASSPLVAHMKRETSPSKAHGHVPAEPSSSTAKRYVPPTSFYAQPAQKPKPQGPL